MKTFRKKPQPVNPIQYLIDFPGLWKKDQDDRKRMTIACRDTDYIPKVKNAGQIKKVDGQEVQIMHDGTMVSLGGYHGSWMSDIITQLKGHHEPQEEKVFYELLKRVRPGSTMIEFGSFWAYYSLWFAKNTKNAKNICCEPDTHNLEIGRKNAALNKKQFSFIQAAAGTVDGETITIASDSKPDETIEVTVRTVDSIMKEQSVEFLELLHLDVQGYELDALKGAQASIKSGKIRFLCVSTHHYFFSKNPNTHNECLSFIKENDGHIMASHTVAESFSGDGLIAASFLKMDEKLLVDTSICHTDQSLFRSPEDDVALLAALVSKINLHEEV